MNRIILINLFAFLFLSLASAQISIKPSFLKFEADNIEQVYIDINISNGSTEDVDIYWEYEHGDSYPSNWKTQICDLNLCYGFDTFQSSPLLGNTIPAGETKKFTLKIKNVIEENNISGNSYGVLRLFDENTFTNEIAVTESNSVSVSDVDLSDLILFPNPTTDIINIKNDEGVASLIIYNLIGRQIKQYHHSVGESHDVSDLSVGIYLVVLEDGDGQILKSMRLSKR